ncbi:MAG: hypothetical protein Q4F57_02400, partial [Weeksellaceae bacterium]|nr:hypothetical protein [Weeksellaceae bacterium]
QREFWDASHQLDKEGMETEQKMAAEKNRRELEDLDRANAEHLAKQQEYAEQINRLNSLSPKTAKEKQEIADSIARYEAAMTRIDDVIATNQKRRAVLEETGRIELKTIEEKYIMLSLEDQKKAFDEEQKMKAVQFEIDVNNLEATEAEKERLRKEFQAQQLTEQSAFLDHLRAQIMQLLNTGDYDALDMENLVLSDEAKERLVEKLKELGFSIKDIQAALSGLSPNQQKEFSSAGFISGTDILGMSPDQWTELFANLDQWRGKLELMVGITQAMQQVWSMFHDANMQKEQEALRRFEATTQRRKDLLQQQLNEGYINQEQYNAKVQELEQVVAKKRAELEYKQAKKEKQNALISSIINTALGVSNALTVKPLVPLGMMLTGLVGSLGLAQTALIASQRLPSPTGYARGGFTQGLGWRDQSGHEVAGVVHADEYVIPKWLREDPVVADVVDWLEARRTGAKGYAQGGVVQAASSQITTTSVPPFEQKLDPVIIDLLGRFLHVVEDIEADGIRAYVVGDERQGKALKHSIDSYNNIRHKNRI